MIEQAYGWSWVTLQTLRDNVLVDFKMEVRTPYGQRSPDPRSNSGRSPRDRVFAASRPSAGLKLQSHSTDCCQQVPRRPDYPTPHTISDYFLVFLVAPLESLVCG